MGIATRERLMNVAEELMATRGVDAVDLDDIRLAAGQRNRSAINYHFGNRTGLVQAIRHRHGQPIDEQRNRILDDLETNDAITVRALIEAYLAPLTDIMRTRSGRNYVIILRDTTFRIGTGAVLGSGVPHLSSMHRLRDQLTSILTGSRTVREIRFRQAALTGGVLLADIAGDVNSGTLTQRQGRLRVPGVTDFVIRGLSG